MLLIFLDTETTGLDPEKHRAVEIAFKIIESENFNIVTSYESMISQTREVWAEADPKSLLIHGLTYEKILKGKSEKVIESEITYYFNHCNLAEKTGCFICQNPSFDRAFFSKIVKLEMQELYHWPYHWLDLASMYWTFRHFLKHNTQNLKESDLSKNHIASYFGLPSEASPHRAMNGVNHLIACYQKIFAPIQVHKEDEVKR